MDTVCGVRILHNSLRSNAHAVGIMREQLLYQVNLLTYLLTYLLTCLPFYFFTYLPNTHLPTNPLTNPPTQLLATRKPTPQTDCSSAVQSILRFLVSN